MKVIHTTSSIVVLCAVSIFSALIWNVAEASDPLQAETIELITKTAERICFTVENEGQESLLEYSGEARVELANFIKYLADIGVEGAVKYQENQYQGPLREDLVETIRASQDCKLAVFTNLAEKLIIPRTERDSEPVNQKNKKAVLDPYNYEWKCEIKIENESHQQVASGELVFGKVIKEAKMSFARVRFSSKRTLILAQEITFDSGAWSLGFFGECLEGECMGFISNTEPHFPIFLVNNVDYDVDAGRINIAGVVMIKKYGKHSRYGLLSGVCLPR